jgi:hypothetical protein
VPTIAPSEFARYRKLKLALSDESFSRTKAIMKGKVVPINTHQGKRERVMNTAEKTR